MKLRGWAIIILILSATCFSQTPYGNNPTAGKFVVINGIRMYCEVYGEGAPVVLLHGNGGSIRNQAQRIEFFSKKFKVIAIDSRAHGKSIDSLSVLTYEMMAKDIHDLLDSLKVDSACIWGQSDGGILALLLAIHYPEKVKKAASFGANLRPDTTAVVPEIMHWAEDMSRNVVRRKDKQLMQLVIDHPHIPLTDLKKIRVPFMVMMGDRDVITLEHSVEMFRNIPEGYLFVMPGSTHAGSYEHPNWFSIVVDDFFSKPFNPRTSLELFTH